MLNVMVFLKSNVSVRCGLLQCGAGRCGAVRYCHDGGINSIEVLCIILYQLGFRFPQMSQRKRKDLNKRQQSVVGGVFV